MKIYLLTGLTLFTIIVNGQVRQPHSLYFMETIPQISQMNPAFQPRANGYVILPGVNADILSDLAGKEIFQQQKDDWFIPIQEEYDYNKLWKSIGEKKSVVFNSGVDLDLIGYGLRVGNGYFSFGISEHFTANAVSPTDLFKLAEQKGITNKKSYDLSPLHAQAMAYLQVQFGYSLKVNNRLTVGMNVKPLFGQAAIVPKVEKFKVVRENSIWDTEIRGTVHSSKLVDKIEWDNDNDIYNVTFKDLEYYQFYDWVNYGFDFSNPGIAFDIGAAYQINDRLNISAALNNLGFISWKEDLKWFSANINVSIDEEITEDKFDEWLESLKDELNGSFKFREQQDNFKTALSPVFYAGASYQLTESLSAGLLSRSVFWKNNFRQSFNLSGYFQPYSFVALNAGVTWQMKNNVYLGGGLTFLLGPLQIYVLTDCIPTRFSKLKDEYGEEIAYLPLHLNSLTARVGINLILGRHGYVNRPMLEKRKNSWN